MAAQVCLKNEFTEDLKYHNLMTLLNFFFFFFFFYFYGYVCEYRHMYALKGYKFRQKPDFIMQSAEI